MQELSFQPLVRCPGILDTGSFDYRYLPCVTANFTRCDPLGLTGGWNHIVNASGAFPGMDEMYAIGPTTSPPDGPGFVLGVSGSANFARLLPTARPSTPEPSQAPMGGGRARTGVVERPSQTARIPSPPRPSPPGILNWDGNFFRSSSWKQLLRAFKTGALVPGPVGITHLYIGD